MKKIIVVAGLTGSGKTDIALSLAQNFKGELINADSRQVYRELNIGTNKGSFCEKKYKEYELKKLVNIKNFGLIENVPIHLFSFLSPHDLFSVYDFQQAVYKIIDSIIGENSIPIMVGGTGMYIDAVIKGYLLSNIQIDQEILSDLSRLDVDELYFKLPVRIRGALNSSDSRNKRRLVNLHVKLLSQKLNDYSDAKPQIFKPQKPRYNSLMIYPEYSWDDLKIRLEKRVYKMFEDGLIDEVKQLLIKYPATAPGLQVMGYLQVVKYLKNEISLTNCIDLIIREHIKYAKRQRTWFEGQGRAYKLVRVRSAEEAVIAVEKFIRN